jgi:transposase
MNPKMEGKFNMAFSVEQISTQPIDHLGIIAGICHRLGIGERIDALLPSKDQRRKVSCGQAVTAMILNGLGYVNRALYLVSDFFENKPINRLLRANIEAKDLNDDLLGRVLDQISAYGSTNLFCEVAYQIGKDFSLLGNSIHLDSTSFSLEGDYYEDLYDDKEQLHITYGHSKDHRPDLKQVILSLCTTGVSNFPLRMEALDGNKSDKKSFHETIKGMKEVQKKFNWPEKLLWVADSALYDKKKLTNESGFDWITRAPETICVVRDLINKEPEQGWTDAEIFNGLKYWESTIEISDSKQRFVVIESEHHRCRKLKTFERSLAKQKEKLEKELKKVKGNLFACEIDAKNAVKNHLKKYPLFKIKEIKLVEARKHANRGRPSKGVEPDLISYQVDASIQDDLEAIERKKVALGRFVLATNVIDTNRFSGLELIKEYKSQQGIERGFRFLKDTRFLVSNVYLKTPSRIEALMMVMTLTLMVYNVGQHWLRESLRERGETLPDQKSKETSTPTLRWVFQLMSGIHVARLTSDSGVTQELVVNVSKMRATIAAYFGRESCEIYGCCVKKE